MKLEIADSVKAVLLLRKDDVSCAQYKEDLDAHLFLQELAEKVTRESHENGTIKFETSFFVLGRSSLAAISSGTTLKDVTEILRIVNEEHDMTVSSIAPHSTGAFECFAYPAVPICLPKKERLPASKAIVPALLFVRTPMSIEDMTQSILSSPMITSHLYELYLGLGVYDLIFYMRFEDLSVLRDTIEMVRERINVLWETSTLVGVPDRVFTNEEKASPRSAYLFSISIRCSNNLVTSEILGDIIKLTKNPSYSHMFVGMNIDDVLTHRQGYMDLEIFCKTKSINEVFSFACSLRKIDGIVDTATVAQIKIK